MTRLDVCAAMTATLVERTDAELLSLLEVSPSKAGWGFTRVVEIDGVQVFAKALPVSDVELEADDRTANLFDLPLSYLYGIGSAGYTAQREVDAQRKASEWVTSGACEHFPLLYHDRQLPLASQTRAMNEDQLDKFITYWDGSDAVRQQTLARLSSTHAHVIFCEYLPFVLSEWLPTNQHAISDVIEQACTITDFLRGHGIAHMDLHPANVVTDGTTIYATDFGLWLDPDFSLSDEERLFLARHQFYDIAEVVATLAVDARGKPFTGSDAYEAALHPYRPVISYFGDFMASIRDGKPTDRYNDTEVVRLLP